jgi:hypothetical protein
LKGQLGNNKLKVNLLLHMLNVGRSNVQNDYESFVFWLIYPPQLSYVMLVGRGCQSRSDWGGSKQIVFTTNTFFIYLNCPLSEWETADMGPTPSYRSLNLARFVRTLMLEEL